MWASAGISDKTHSVSTLCTCRQEKDKTVLLFSSYSNNDPQIPFQGFLCIGKTVPAAWMGGTPACCVGEWGRRQCGGMSLRATETTPAMELRWTQTRNTSASCFFQTQLLLVAKPAAGTEEGEVCLQNSKWGHFCFQVLFSLSALRLEMDNQTQHTYITGR